MERSDSFATAVGLCVHFLLCVLCVINYVCWLLRREGGSGRKWGQNYYVSHQLTPKSSTNASVVRMYCNIDILNSIVPTPKVVKVSFRYFCVSVDLSVWMCVHVPSTILQLYSKVRHINSQVYHYNEPNSHSVTSIIITTVDQLLPLSVDNAFPDVNILEILGNFSVKQYFLGSPMVLSTMMEMRCATPQRECLIFTTFNLVSAMESWCDNQYGMVTPSLDTNPCFSNVLWSLPSIKAIGCPLGTKGYFDVCV